MIERQEAVELDHLAGGAQVEHAAADLGGDVDGGALELGRLHLARDRAVPDQLVELGLVGLDGARHLARAARRVGRADGFVRLLRVLRLGLIAARRAGDVVGAVVLADHAADGGDRFRVHVDAVGTHISDETDGLAADVDAFVEPLREPHGVRRREAELAARFLLQVEVVNGGGGLRRAGFASTEATLKAAVSSACLKASASAPEPMSRRWIFWPSAPTRRASKVSPRGVASVATSDQYSRGDEFLDLEFAVADQPQRHRLHAAGRARAGQLAPQHRREREADEIVERAAGEIGIDQRAVDVARVLHRVEHRLLGDGVEHHALDGLLLERLLLLEHLEHVPGDGLALAVGVGGQDQLVGALDGPGDVVEPLLGLVVDLPDHVEVGLGIDRAVLGRQVADMAERSQDLVARAKILVDGLGLGRRFNNDDIHLIPLTLAGRICTQFQDRTRPHSWPEHGEDAPRCQIRAPVSVTASMGSGSDRE